MNRERWVGPASFLLLALFACLPRAAEGQSRNHLYDRWQVAGGAAALIYNTSFRFDSDNGDTGTEIDAEEVLGLERSNVRPRVAGRFRMGQRHELELGYQWATRGAETRLEDTISVGDTVFDAGLLVNTTFNTDQAFLTYRYAIKATDQTQLGVGVGLGAIFLDEEIAAVAGASGGNDTLFVPVTQSKQLTAPVGSLGLYGRFRLGERWYLEVDARALYARVSEVKAEVFEGGAAVRYFLSDTFAAELGYGAGAYAVTIVKDRVFFDVTTQIKYTVQGIRLGVVWGP